MDNLPLLLFLGFTVFVALIFGGFVLLTFRKARRTPSAGPAAAAPATRPLPETDPARIAPVLTFVVKRGMIGLFLIAFLNFGYRLMTAPDMPFGAFGLILGVGIAYVILGKIWEARTGGSLGSTPGVRLPDDGPDAGRHDIRFPSGGGDFGGGGGGGGGGGD